MIDALAPLCAHCPMIAPPCPLRVGGVCPGPPRAFPDCHHRGDQVESGAGCGCGPKHLCRRDTRIVSATDCALCLAGPEALDGPEAIPGELVGPEALGRLDGDQVDPEALDGSR